MCDSTDEVPNQGMADTCVRYLIQYPRTSMPAIADILINNPARLRGLMSFVTRCATAIPASNFAPRMTMTLATGTIVQVGGVRMVCCLYT